MTSPRIARGARLRAAQVSTELALELEQKSLGSLLAYSRHARESCTFLQRNRLRKLGDRQTGKHRQRSASTDTRNLDQLAESRALAMGCKPVELMGILRTVRCVSRTTRSEIDGS